jgi:hypothetical protein
MVAPRICGVRLVYARGAYVSTWLCCSERRAQVLGREEQTELVIEEPAEPVLEVEAGGVLVERMHEREVAAGDLPVISTT